MNQTDFLKNIEGRNEDGTSKVVCSINILIKNNNNEIETVNDYVIEDGVVYFAIQPNELSMIDLCFDSNTEYDFVQSSNICEKYFNMVNAASKGEIAFPILTVTIAEQGNPRNYVSFLALAWSYLITGEQKLCSGFRFIANSDDINFIELSEEQINVLFSQNINNTEYEKD